MSEQASVNLIPAGSGYQLQVATAINDNGQIVVNATSPAAGQTHALLLTPGRHRRPDDTLALGARQRRATDAWPSLALVRLGSMPGLG